MATLRDLIRVLDDAFPFSRAEKSDKVGLQIGDANAPVSRVLVAHEVTSETIEEAHGCDVLFVYHPLIFRALENLDFANHTARLAARCIAQSLNVVAVHTALDNAPFGHALGDELAKSLGLDNVRVLKESGRESLFKIVVFVPDEALEKVSLALWQAGAGRIGDYERASFRARGIGTFRPLLGANPYDGEIGRDAAADEWRLEVVVRAAQRDRAVAAMLAAHPYEEVAYDVYALHNSLEAFGAARFGELQSSTRIHDFVEFVTSKLHSPNVRVVTSGKAEIRSVACVPGAGASYIESAARAGCDCLVTGDIKHHDALMATAHGLALIDVTHVATERAAIDLIADTLNAPSVKAQSGVEVRRSALDTNPFSASKVSL